MAVTIEMKALIRMKALVEIPIELVEILMEMKPLVICKKMDGARSIPHRPPFRENQPI
jgi:hypothetical protein